MPRPRERTRVAVALVALTVAGGAMAQSIEVPAMKVGDRFTYRSSGGPDQPATWSETVVEVLANGRYRVRTEGATTPGVLEFDGPGNLVQPPPYPSLRPMKFPIEVGRSWSHAVSMTPSSTRSIAYRAVAVEKRTTGAGTLDCVRIEGTETTTNSGIAVPSQVKLWYCPAARAIARKETRIPMVGLVTQELTAYHLAP